MIEVKALRPTQNSTASAEETYRKTQDEPVPSRWPAIVAVIVLAVAGYLRSLVSAQADPAEAEAEPQPAGSDTIESEKDPDETGSLSDEKAAPEPEKVTLGSGAAGDPVQGLAVFLGIDSPPIDYERLPLPAFVPGAFEFGLGRVSNDNRFAPGQSGRASSGLGGSDGGGSKPALPIVVAPFKPVMIVPLPRDEEPAEPVDPEDPRPRNRAPRVAGVVQLGEIGPCQTLMLTLAGLLVGASDADGDTLLIRNLQVSSGTITLAEGGWQYKPMVGYFGPVTVSYTVSDGVAGVTQTATFNVVEELVLDGTAGDDVLAGTDCRDLIRAGDGNDIVDARGGRDTVHGGSGHDIIFAGAGDDTVYGGAGNDVIYGGAGNDQLYGEDGDDRLFGENGDDLLVGGAGNDLLDGGAGNDTLLGAAGADTVLGREGNDVIAAGEGDDAVYGGDGDDVVDAGTGDDKVEGGTGDDIIHAGEGEDHVEGGQGSDVVDAGAGDDKVEGESGDDVLDGGAGADCLIGGAGDDTLLGRSGEDVLVGGDDDDTLDGGEGADTVTAGAGDDTVVASLDAANDCLDGGSGHDTLDLSGSTAGVTVDLTENKAVGIEIGSDTVLDFEALIGGEGNDHFIIGLQAARMTGGNGDDRFEFNVPAPAENDLIHQILDLQEGDRIVVKQYEIHSDAAAGGTEIDPFSEIYTESGEAERPFRFRIEKINDEERTYVDVFVAQQDEKDLSIEIYGNHKLYYYSY